MLSPIEVLTQLAPDTFAKVVSASPRKFREEIFRRAGVRTKRGASFSLKSNSKNEIRIQKLQRALEDGADVGENLLEELIRNYLYTRRSMLGDALDFFDVPHDDGLTDSELEFLDDLDIDKGKELRDLLLSKHDDADVDLYLNFMNIQYA